VIVAVVSVMFDTPTLVMARLALGVGVGAAVALGLGVGVGADVAVGVGVAGAVWLAVGAGVAVGLGLGVAGSGVGVAAGVGVGLGVGVAGSGVGVGGGVGSAAVTLNSALACPEPDAEGVTPSAAAVVLGSSCTPIVCAPGSVFGTMKVARNAPRPFVDRVDGPVSSPSHVSCTRLFWVNPCPVATTFVPVGPAFGDKARVGPAAVVFAKGTT
jgi:hypothetical protein